MQKNTQQIRFSVSIVQINSDCIGQLLKAQNVSYLVP